MAAEAGVAPAGTDARRGYGCTTDSAGLSCICSLGVQVCRTGTGTGTGTGTRTGLGRGTKRRAGTDRPRCWSEADESGAGSETVHGGDDGSLHVEPVVDDLGVVEVQGLISQGGCRGIPDQILVALRWPVVVVLAVCLEDEQAFDDEVDAAPTPTICTWQSSRMPRM